MGTKEAKACGLTYEAWRPQIKTRRLWGILSVAQGSSEEPAYDFLKHNVEQTNKKPIVLIGKRSLLMQEVLALNPQKIWVGCVMINVEVWLY